MNTQELAKKISQETDLNYTKSYELLKKIIEIIVREILRGQMVKLRGLMTLFVDIADQRTYHDAKAQQLKTKPKRFVLKVKISKQLRKEVDGKKAY